MKSMSICLFTITLCLLSTSYAQKFSESQYDLTSGSNTDSQSDKQPSVGWISLSTDQPKSAKMMLLFSLACKEGKGCTTPLPLIARFERLIPVQQNECGTVYTGSEFTGFSMRNIHLTEFTNAACVKEKGYSVAVKYHEYFRPDPYQGRNEKEEGFSLQYLK